MHSTPDRQQAARAAGARRTAHQHAKGGLRFLIAGAIAIFFIGACVVGSLELLTEFLGWLRHVAALMKPGEVTP